MRALRLAAAAVGVLLMTGCGIQDRSFERSIPAAIEQADIGIVDPEAGTTTSGSSTILVVGGTVPAGEIGDEALRTLIEIAVDDGSISPTYLQIALFPGESGLIDVSDALVRLGADPYDDGSIDWGDAERIAESEARR